MFYKASKFNQDISGWDVSRVEKMDYMFFMATKFNQEISGWNVSRVKDMCNMLSMTDFNQDIYKNRTFRVNEGNSWINDAIILSLANVL